MLTNKLYRNDKHYLHNNIIIRTKSILIYFLSGICIKAYQCFLISLVYFIRQAAQSALNSLKV